MGSDDSPTVLTRREFGAMAAGALAALPGSAQDAVSRRPALDIADWSYFWYGVERVTLARGTVCNGMQMYVERWIPTEVRHPFPVVLVHGGYRQGSDWLSTPDGQRGWGTHFLEEGYKVYVVDRPGQGRCPYQPYVHGSFDREAPTFEKADWPGATDQYVAAMGQPMANNPITQGVWRSRSALLLDDIGPAILITHGDGAAFALIAAAERPTHVKGIVAVEPPATAFQGALPKLPIAAVFPGVSANAPLPPTVSRISLANHGSMPMLAKNNRDALQPVLDWLDSNSGNGVVGVRNDPHPNKESTALKLADQGCFWVGIQPKTTSYGTIALGQMFVQYMIPAEKRSPYPVVMVHGGGGQGTHMMGIGGRPGWVHYFVQAGYSVYWLDRPSYGRSPYHPDALGPSHLPNVPPYEGLITSTAVFNTGQWPGPGGMTDPLIGQFMACESGNVSDEAFHSDLVWRGGAELLDRIGPSILVVHAFGGFFAWGVADRRPKLVKAIMAMEINGNPFATQLRWGLTAGPMTFDPPVTDPAQFTLVDRTEPPDSPRPVPPSYKLQTEPARKWKNLQGIPIGWLTSEFGGGGSPVANVEFLKQVGCSAEMLRLRDHGILGNGNLMLLEKNNHEVFGVIRDWLDRNVGPRKA